MPREYHFELLADYFQFYLEDEGIDSDTGILWNKENTELMLALGPGIIAVGTARNMTVPVKVVIQETEPALELEKWDKVNECSVTINSGNIVVMGCTDYYPDASRIKVISAVYRARIHYGQLAELSEDGLDGEDHYEVILWPDTEERLVERIK